MANTFVLMPGLLSDRAVTNRTARAAIGDALPQGAQYNPDYDIYHRYENTATDGNNVMAGDTVVATFQSPEEATRWNNTYNARLAARQALTDDAARQLYDHRAVLRDHPDWFDDKGNYLEPDQRKPETAQETINTATTTAANQAAREHQQAQQMQQMQQIQAMQQAAGPVLQRGLLNVRPNNTPMGNDSIILQFQHGLMGDKLAYQQAQQNNDEEGMRAAAERGAVRRKAAAEMGIDLSNAYTGSDNTIAELQAAMDVNRLRGYQSIIGGMTSGEVYDKLFNDAINDGASKKQADQYAAGKAAQYQAQRLGDLTTALYDYGIDDKHGINEFGMQIMQAMRNEDPDSITLPYMSHGKPINDYVFLTTQQGKDADLRRMLDQGQHQFDWSRALNQDKLNAQSAMQDKELAFKYYATDQSNATRRAQIAAARSARQGGSRGGGSSGNSDGLTKKQVEAAQDANNLIAKFIRSASSDGDMDLDKYYEEVGKIKDLDGDTRGFMNKDVPYAYNFVREFVNNPDGENTKKYWDAISDDKDLLEYVREINPDYIAYMQKKG